MTLRRATTDFLIRLWKRCRMSRLKFVKEGPDDGVIEMRPGDEFQLYFRMYNTDYRSIFLRVRRFPLKKALIGQCGGIVVERIESMRGACIFQGDEIEQRLEIGESFQEKGS